MDPREIVTVFREEVRRAAGRTWYRVSTLAVPVLLLIAALAVPIIQETVSNGGDGEDDAGRVGLVDLSGVLSADAVAAEPDIRPFPSRQAGVDALVAEEVSALFVVAEDYLATGRVEWLYTGQGLSASIAGEDAADQVSALLREALVEDRLGPEATARFLSPAQFDSLVLNPDGSVKEGATEVEIFSVSYVFAFLLMMAVFTGSGYLLESVSDDKENRMIEVLLTSASSTGILAGKVLALGAIGLLQMAVWAGSLMLIGPRVVDTLSGLGQLTVEPILLVWTVAFFVAGYFVMGVVMAGIGAATSSYQEGSQISILVILPAAVPIWFFQAIAGNPDGGLARALSFIPITAPIAMMLRMGAAEIPVAEIVASLVVTVLGGVALLWVAARVFRAGLLMYGQRMSLARLARTLREAA
jgi:ABC-2 type transport system permease protein